MQRARKENLKGSEDAKTKWCIIQFTKRSAREQRHCFLKANKTILSKIISSGKNQEKILKSLNSLLWIQVFQLFLTTHLIWN